MYPNNWGEYEIYIWTILWFFWLTPFWINGLTAWTNHSLSSLWLFDIWILPLKDIFIIIWNLLIYFVFFYLVFRNDLKKLLSKQFSVNKFIDKILKWFSIVIYYLIYLKIFVMILSLLINHTLNLNHWF